jgi:hypothetical protein
MNGSAKPRFDTKGLLFFRKENESYASFISPMNPSEGLQLLNPGIMEIADMCTGDVTADEILARYIASHASIDETTARSNVSRAMILLGHYSLLRTESGAVLDELAGATADGVRRLGGDDLRAIRSLLTGGEFPSFDRVPKTYYTNPYLPEALYEEMFVRLRVFNGKEAFFGSFSGGQLTFAMGVLDNAPVKPTGSVSILAGLEGQDLEQALSEVLSIALADLKRTYLKLTWSFLVKPMSRERFPEIAERLGAKRTATLTNEFGPNIDEVQYEWNLGAENGQSTTVAGAGAGET